MATTLSLLWERFGDRTSELGHVDTNGKLADDVIGTNVSAKTLAVIVTSKGFADLTDFAHGGSVAVISDLKKCTEIFQILLKRFS